MPLPILSNVVAVTASGAGWWNAGLALAIALAAAAMLRRVRGTTLAAPAAWAIISALVIAAVEAQLAWRGIAAETLTASLWRYTAAVGTFCPLMAVLGAKRPQDRGWQWVVLSLWLILLVPAGQALTAPAGNQLELFSAWRLLLWVLIAMGLLNYLPTRYALTTGLVAAGQAALLAGYLLDFSAADQPRQVAMGLALIGAGIVCGWLLGTKRCARGDGKTAAGAASLDSQVERWLAFRDAFGAFWGLRVLQRVNQTAELSHWPVRLQWSGFASASDLTVIVRQENGAVDERTLLQIEQAFDSLLRRFERLDKPAVLAE